MKLLLSKRIKLPILYFITDREEIKDIPIGVPFIYGDKKDENYFIRLLEYEAVYKAAKATGYKFKFKELLKDAGFDDLITFGYQHPAYFDIKKSDEEFDYDIKLHDVTIKDFSSNGLRDFIKDAAAYVNIEVLKNLNIFPIWVDKVEEAIKTNIHNFAVFNSNMYNKKLDGMYGGLELSAPGRNLIIVDISGSIPKGVSSTCLVMSKNLAETFYADLLITGSKSTLYEYGNLHELNVDTIYQENGMDNDQVYFKKLVTESERSYDTAIVFGDNHTPCQSWSNKFNMESRYISREDGRKMCKWAIKKLISFHTSSIVENAGYSDWFTISESNITRMDNWVKYLD